jgi:thiol-disulfide isomerase/thioredoxin
MKKLILLFAIMALNLSCNGQEKFSDQALAENLTDLGNNNTNLNRILMLHKGKTVVIEVWASWCSDCVKNLPKIKEMQGTFTDVDFVFLSCDKNVEAWKKGIEKHQLNGDHFLIPEGMKGNFAKSIDLTWIPRYIIIDKTGKIALYNAVETDNEKVIELIKSIK